MNAFIVCLSTNSIRLNQSVKWINETNIFNKFSYNIFAIPSFPPSFLVFLLFCSMWNSLLMISISGLTNQNENKPKESCRCRTFQIGQWHIHQEFHSFIVQRQSCQIGLTPNSIIGKFTLCSNVRARTSKNLNAENSHFIFCCNILSSLLRLHQNRLSQLDRFKRRINAKLNMMVNYACQIHLHWFSVGRLLSFDVFRCSTKSL